MSNASGVNRIAVVTGGARGIGRAIGQWCLAHGYDVALLDIDRATLADRKQTFVALAITKTQDFWAEVASARSCALPKAGLTKPIG